jgi:hypothetical protein
MWAMWGCPARECEPEWVAEDEVFAAWKAAQLVGVTADDGDEPPF